MRLWLNAYHCMLFSSRLRVRVRIRIRFIVWLVSGYAHVFGLLSVFAVTLSHCNSFKCAARAREGVVAESRLQPELPDWAKYRQSGYLLHLSAANRAVGGGGLFYGFKPPKLTTNVINLNSVFSL